jgi:hypothetical protein
MIHPSGIFRYKAEFTSDSFKESDVVLQGTEIERLDIDRLVGHHPTIRFWRDRLVLVASKKAKSRLRNASFAIGDAVPLSARAGDWLYVVRTGAGGIGLSLLRDKTLVLAIGAVTAVPLGMNIKVFNRPERLGGFVSRLTDRWLEVQIESERVRLQHRTVNTVKDYEIYVEHPWEDGIPGVDECVSICGANGPVIKIACVRSAVLLGHSNLKLTNWDGSENFI